jgi:WD40 repeat protein
VSEQTGQLVSGCPSDAALERALGNDAATGAAAVRAHLSGCRDCERRARQIRENLAFMKGVLAELGELAAGPAQTPPAGVSLPGYRLIRLIARGGQGAVYEGVQESTKRRVAIKLLEPGDDVTTTGRGRRRIEREAEIAAGLRHPSIVTVYHSAALADGRYALAMEYVDGASIDEWARGIDEEARSLPRDRQREALRTKVRAVAAVCEAVHHAHLNGVIHRDLKPANVLMTRDGLPRVVDFGIARRPGFDDRVTRAGGFAGTLACASPEQVSGDEHAVDARSDIYSLGLMLYGVLTGRQPYDTDGSLTGAISNITTTPPRGLGTVEPGVQPAGSELEAIVAKALAKDRRDRYQSAEALRADLVAWLEGRVVTARSASAWYAFRKLAARHRTAAIVASAFVVVLAAFALAMAWSATRLDVQRGLLADALASSTIQRGRLLGLTGENARAEDLLWPEFLRAGGGAALDDPNLFTASPPDRLAAAWALAEFYSRHPTLLTLPGLGESAHALIAPDGSSVLVVNRDGARRRIGLPGGEPLDVRGPVVETPLAGTIINNDDAEFFISSAREHAVVSLSSDVVQRIPALPAAQTPVASTAERLITSAPEGPVVLRDRATLLPVATIENAHPGVLMARPTVTRDGRWFYTSNGNRVLRLSTEGGQVRATYALPANMWDEAVRPGIRGVRPSPDGTGFAAILLSRVLLFRTEGTDPEAAPIILPHRGPVSDVRFSADGRRVLTWGIERNFRVWDTRTGELIRGFESAYRVWGEGTLSHDGRQVAICDERGTLRLFEVERHGWFTQLDQSRNTVQTVRFSPDGSIFAAASSDGSVRAWRSADRAPLWSAEFAGDPQTALCFSRDGQRVYVGSESGRFNILNASDGSRAAPERLLARANQLHASPDGRLLALTSTDSAIRLIDADTGALAYTLNAHTERPGEAVFSPDGTRLVSIGMDAQVLLWDLATRKPIASAKLPSASRAVAFAPDGRTIAVGSDDWSIRLLDTDTLALRRLISGAKQHVFGLRFHPQGKLLFSACRDNTLQVWDVRSGREVAQLDGHQDLVLSLDLSADGRTMVTSSADRTVGVWDLDYYRRHIKGNAPGWLGRAAVDASGEARAR